MVHGLRAERLNEQGLYGLEKRRWKEQRWEWVGSTVNSSLGESKVIHGGRGIG